MTTLTVIGLFVIGIFLLLVEIFIPGGIAGIFGILCLLAGIGGAFTISVKIGTGLFLALILLGPVALWLWLKYFPVSPMGKALILDEDAAEWHGYKQNQCHLVGREGVAHTPLHPSGVALIDGHRVDVVTQGEMIERGAGITVQKVEGNRIVVTLIEPKEEGETEIHN